MATVQPAFPFVGTFGNLTVYKRHDMDKHIVRTKGGPSRKQIFTSDNFVNTRRNISEFGGRATASKWFLWALEPLRPLADYNLPGPLNALIKPVQEMDAVNEWGKRHILLSKYPQILEGFSLNRRRNPLETIIRNTIRFTLNKQTMEATIDVPALVPGINFHVPPGNYPFFSLVFNPVIVPDLYYNESEYLPSHENYVTTLHHIDITEWYPVLNGAPAISRQLKIDFTPPDENFILLMSMGIQFGTIGANGEVMQVPRAGAAKILGAV